jgi:hypothetical protein
MTALRVTTLSLLAAGALAVPLSAQVPRAQARPPQTLGRSPAFQNGYDRGANAGAEDRRRGDRFDYVDETDYRRATDGYRREYGPEDRYRNEFRYGYQSGYRVGFEGYRQADPYGRNQADPYGRYEDPRQYGRGRAGVPPPWANGRGRYGAPGRYDLAYESGFTDGYEAGLDDGDRRRALDPTNERRYRSADHGYERQYGPREVYKNRYREAFRQGYEAGYEDGRRYGNRNERPWWWLFGR